jgi:Ca2+-binding EF-hand superfamily protein
MIILGVRPSGKQQQPYYVQNNSSFRFSPDRQEDRVLSKISRLALISMLIAGGVAATSAFATSERFLTAGEKRVEQLLRLMDKDRNGRVSKEEFMQFMEAEFDRIDADKNGELTTKELSHFAPIHSSTHTSPHR